MVNWENALMCEGLLSASADLLSAICPQRFPLSSIAAASGWKIGRGKHVYIELINIYIINY